KLVRTERITIHDYDNTLVKSTQTLSTDSNHTNVNKDVLIGEIGKGGVVWGDDDSTVQEVNPIKETMINAFESYNEFASGNILPELPDVTAAGGSVDFIASTGSVQIVIDKTGNVGLVFSGGLKGKTDIEGGISAVVTVSYDMESADDLDGVASFYGAGADLGEVLAVSADYTYGIATTEDGRQVTTHSAGIGGNVSWVPAEIHTGVTKTKTITINIYDIANDIYEFFK
ncbi:MAG: hypothetical protein SCL54_17670, partial [Bacillota bacterium]|nr:hypothetical protein [Bacillota bacterium]